ncbi:hypothetical protein Tco_0939308 [Tanacetum coccineum]|uniref:Xylulose kinase-1 n=1 Tax=Tanacetum coccineum TaxID=301880 RepID=A0ABQ5DKM4_9ASTR
MSALKFADSYNMVAFLAKPTESNGVEQILDFLIVNPIKYALTVNPTIYTSCIEQFWATVKVKTINGEVQLQALVDRKKVIITETSGWERILWSSYTLISNHDGSSSKRNSASSKLYNDEAANEENVPTQYNDPPLSRVNTLRSGEDKLKLKEFMDLCTKLSDRVLDLETTKTAQANEIASLKKRVKKAGKGKRKSIYITAPARRPPQALE